MPGWLRPIPMTTLTATPIITGTAMARPCRIPAQAATWSILRMPAASRLGAALAVSAGLWAVVWLAMR